MSSIKIKISEAEHLITIALQSKLVPMIHGSPAVGKSAIVRNIAKKFGLKLIDLRLSQCDPTDLLGFPHISGENQHRKAGYVPMETFPVEGDKIPEGYNGWLLFLDELVSAPPGVQAAAYKLILDKMVGLRHLHRNVAIIGAGNLETDGAIVFPMSSALKSRMTHLEVEVDAKHWSDWAKEQDFDDRVTSFIDFRPDLIYTFSAEHTDRTYASPRTWEFTNQILNTVGKVEKSLIPLLAGTIGEGTAREFYGFCQIRDRLPKIEQIVANPNTIEVPKEPSVLFALTGALAKNVTEDNCEAMLDFVNRIPPEFQVICIRTMIKRSPVVKKSPSFGPWLHKLAAELV